MLSRFTREIYNSAEIDDDIFVIIMILTSTYCERVLIVLPVYAATCSLFMYYNSLITVNSRHGWATFGLLGKAVGRQFT